MAKYAASHEVQEADPEERKECGIELQNISFSDIEAPINIANAGSSALPLPGPTPFTRQIYWNVYKNALILSRRPKMLFLMLFSTVFSVLMAWFTGPDKDTPLSDLDVCGAASIQNIHNSSGDQLEKATLNDSWKFGLSIIVLSLGPMAQAVCSFLVVQAEIEMKLLGSLRLLGVRDSVYWISWFMTFSVSSFVNALLATVVAKMIPVHVFQAVYFGGIFASFLFLQLSLVASSLFLAAFCGTFKKLLILAVFLMICSVFYHLIASAAYFHLFWSNSRTDNGSIFHSDDNIEVCENPIVSEEFGNSFKTAEEASQIQNHDFFVGCYREPGFTTIYWNPSTTFQSFRLVTMFLSPYFHFTSTYSNFLGFTAMIDKAFTFKHASMSPEDLANEAFPISTTNDQASFLFPQGSTIVSAYNYKVLGICEWINECKQEYASWMLQRNGEHWKTEDRDVVFPLICPSEDTWDTLGYKVCGNHCRYVPDAVISFDSPSVHDMLGYQAILVILYLFLASYWIQIFPAGNGARKSVYFFVTPSYWFGTCEKDQNIQSASCITLNSVSKKFGSFEAVKNLTLTLQPNKITALLGKNGAGKSTLINILSCESCMSNGEVAIFGNSLMDSSEVRRLMGVCKQDDYLWPQLTAKEHLNICGGLRGVEPLLHDAIVEEFLKSVDLSLVMDKYAETFSGGMKRRLSVACATIGDCPLIILDEPTTGMDPISRRYVWKHLKDIKDGRVVLITTHAMDEADLLANEVVIMKNGSLAAQGTPLDLKSKYGSALQFSIITDKNKGDDTKEEIQKILTLLSGCVSVWSSSDSENINVKFKHVDELCLKALTTSASWLEADESRATEYGFSNCSLEEVFLALTKDEENDDNETLPGGNQIETDCYCFRSRSKAEDMLSPPVETIEDRFDYLRHIASFYPQPTLAIQVEAYMRLAVARQWSGRRSLGQYMFFGVLILVLTCAGFLFPDVQQYSDEGEHVVFFTAGALALSLMLPSLISPFYVDKTSGTMHLMQSQGLAKKSFVLGLAVYAFTIQLLFGLALFLPFYAMPFFREISLNQGQIDQIDHLYLYGAHIDDNGTSIHAFRSPGNHGTIILVPFIFALSTIGTSFASSIIPAGFNTALVVVLIMTFISSISGFANYMHFQNENIDGTLNDAWHTSPVDYYDQCDTQNSILTAEDDLNCVGHAVNWIYSDIWPSICTRPIVSSLPQFGAVQLLLMAMASKIKFYSATPGYIENVFIPKLEANGVNCSESVCEYPRLHSLLRANALFFVLGATLIALLGSSLFFAVHFPPPFLTRFKNNYFKRLNRAIRKRLQHSIYNTTDGIRDIREDSSKCEDDNIVLREVIEEKNKVHDIIEPLLRIAEQDSEENGIQPLVSDGSVRKGSNFTPIVMQDLRKEYPSSGISPPKVALHSLNLHVPKGQVLGLLGENGSGKSTCLKILSANLAPSGGIALVAGCDICNESKDIFGKVGSCPQSDVVWPNLSVKSHLMFFARLKGLPRDLIEKAAHDVANAVGLGLPPVYNRIANQLSGGMRRRLSIAISILGAPRVLLLDEPTTGLDPSTRYQIWGMIKAFSTEERALIISTHMMIEADNLCNRIAIISNGDLKVVATQEQLKDQYGSGYKLQLNLSSSSKSHENRAMSFVRNNINKKAKLEMKQAQILHISLPRTQSIGKFFKAMYTPERLSEGGILHFLFQQTSLEDVFIKLGNTRKMRDLDCFQGEMV